MKLKTAEINGKTYAETAEDKPIYVDDDGKDIPMDVPFMTAQVRRLNFEAMSYRKEKGDLEAKLKTFDGIEDAEAARKAVETVANIDAGKLVAAGKVEEIKDAAKKAAQEQVAAANKASAEEAARLRAENQSLQGQLHRTMIGGGFSRLKMIVDEKHPKRLAIPSDIVEAMFSKNFKVEDGRPVGYDNHGNKIFSRAKPGEIADMDEAVEALVDQYPNRDQILRGSGNKGDGARNSNNNSGGGPDLSKLSPVERINAARAAAVR